MYHDLQIINVIVGIETRIKIKIAIDIMRTSRIDKRNLTKAKRGN